MVLYMNDVLIALNNLRVEGRKIIFIYGSRLC